MNATLRMRLSPEEAAPARWRVWAAEERDRRPPHDSAQPDAARQADTLCRLLDAWGPLARRAARPDGPANLAEPLEVNVLMLVGWLVLAGVRPPA
jgi:hypothetical protein